MYATKLAKTSKFAFTSIRHSLFSPSKPRGHDGLLLSTVYDDIAQGANATKLILNLCEPPVDMNVHSARWFMSNDLICLDLLTLFFDDSVFVSNTQSKKDRQTNGKANKQWHYCFGVQCPVLLPRCVSC